MKRVQLSDDALADLNAGYWFYEVQEPGLGDYFAACLKADIEGLGVSAGIHSIVYEDYHRLISKTFPFGVFYTMQRDTATIWAVVDLRKDPDWIKQRLSQ